MLNHTLRRAAVLILLPALIACSKGASSASTVPGGSTSAGPARSGVSAAAYVHTLCTSMNDWIGAIKTRAAQVGPDLTAADTLEKRRALAVTYFGDMADITGQLVDKMNAEGAPDVSGGDANHAAFVSAFMAAQQIFVAAQTSAKSLPVDSPQAFKAALNKSLSALQSASDQIQTALGALNGGDLDTAATTDSACQSLGS